jgi:hypothetical protein
VNLTLEQKIAGNVWDHIDDVLPVLEAARTGRWSWLENSMCKYIELRIDMRDGGCVIKDRDGKRIEPEQLRHQLCGSPHTPWPQSPPPLSAWQEAQIASTSPQQGEG